MISITDKNIYGLVRFRELEPGEVFKFTHDDTNFYIKLKNHLNGTINTANIMDGFTSWTNEDKQVISIELEAEVV